MSLLAMQRGFAAWLTTGGGDEPPGLASGSQAGLNAHLGNYRGSLVACLEAAFPVTVAWLGAAAFLDLVRAHAAGSPPNSWSLDHYAASFGGAVLADPSHDLVIRELVQLELAMDAAFTASDRVALTRDGLAATDWEQALLTLASGGQVLQFETNAAAIWNAVTHQQDCPAACQLDARATVLVWRQSGDVCFRGLDDDEAALFGWLSDGCGLTALLAALQTNLTEAEAIARAGALLARWADEGSVAIIANQSGPVPLAGPVLAPAPQHC